VAPPRKTSDNAAMVRFATLGVLLALAAPASADTFKLFGEAHGGGMWGTGVAGDQKDSAFFGKAKGGAYGALIGAELLFFDALIEHTQYINGDGLKTWTQFGAGVHFTSDQGDAQDKKAGKGGYIEFGGYLWFGLGTGAQVMPPLDNAQITDKGFLGEARLGFGEHLNRVFDLGVVVPVSYGYFFKSGNGAAANDLSTNYRGIEAQGLVVLRANIRLF
jgi:hypothetical protein